MPTLTTKTRSAHTDFATAADAVPASTAVVVDCPELAQPCSDCISRLHCPLAHLMTAENCGRSTTLVSRSHTLTHGEHLYRERDRAVALYVVKSGSVKVYFTSEDGSEQVVAFCMPGNVLALGALGVAQHSSSALALENTSICVIPIKSLEDTCARMSSSGWPHCLYKLLSRELIRDHRTRKLITRKDAEAKMASFLINLSKRFRSRGYSASSFNLSMKRSDIGSHLGLAVETVSRVLTRFQEDGLLCVERRRVQIFDYHALQAIAGGQLSH